jgi:DNA polymerase-3 subunit delta
MVALKAAEVDRFVARPDPAQPIMLVYGPDAGLVHERVEALIRGSIDDPKDPFSLARLEGDELASEPTRLVEEANTIPLFGGRRAIWVRAGSRNFAPALEALVTSPVPDCRVVIEAGELRRSSPLRAICERAKNAIALPCYQDGETALVRLIEDEMREAGLTIAPEARAALIPLLGGDRLASRRELHKLALYACGKTTVEFGDVMAVVADASAVAIEGLIDAAFAGRTAELETQFAKLRTAGTTPSSVLPPALRQLAQLHKARLAIEAGASIKAAIARIAPPVRLNRAHLVEAALRTWTSSRLERVMAQLAEAVLESRRQSVTSDLIAQRALLVIAMNARRRR